MKFKVGDFVLRSNEAYQMRDARNGKPYSYDIVYKVASVRCNEEGGYIEMQLISTSDNILLAGWWIQANFYEAPAMKKTDTDDKNSDWKIIQSTRPKGECPCRGVIGVCPYHPF